MRCDYIGVESLLCASLCEPYRRGLSSITTLYNTLTLRSTASDFVAVRKVGVRGFF